MAELGFRCHPWVPLLLSLCHSHSTPRRGGRENQGTHTCLLSPSGLVLHWLPEAPPTATPRASAVLPSSSPTAVPLPTALHAGQPLLPELRQSGYFNGASPSRSFRSFYIRQRPRPLIVYTSHDPPSPWCLGEPCSCAPHKGASIQTPPHWTDAAHKVSTARQHVAPTRPSASPGGSRASSSVEAPGPLQMLAQHEGLDASILQPWAPTHPPHSNFPGRPPSLRMPGHQALLRRLRASVQGGLTLDPHNHTHVSHSELANGSCTIHHNRVLSFGQASP